MSGSGCLLARTDPGRRFFLLCTSAPVLLLSLALEAEFRDEPVVLRMVALAGWFNRREFIESHRGTQSIDPWRGEPVGTKIIVVINRSKMCEDHLGDVEGAFENCRGSKLWTSRMNGHAGEDQLEREVRADRPRGDGGQG